MAKQRIDFEHGGPITGDSGERGDTAIGEDSIKPTNDGESAVASNFNRPGENVRQRTERLRDAGENQMYLQDQMKWIITAGRADGYANGEPIPGVENWDPMTGIFEITENLVLQPLNTPKEDLQETKEWTFTGTPDAVVSVKPLLDGVDAYKSKRAYNHANLLQVVWLEADPGDLSGAVVAGYCDVTVDGDPPHILTITIRDDGQTQVSHIQTALNAVDAILLEPNGIQQSVTGDLSVQIDYSADVDPKEYEFSGTFERELHYMTPALFADFFLVPANALDDGDTLAIWFEEFIDDGTMDPPTGRRQAIPSNSNTTVGTGVGELFKTTLYPERIPLAIPLCKRIGDYLFWIDGTVISPDQTEPVPFGINGATLYDLPVPITGEWFDVGSPPAWVPASITESFDNIINDLATATSPLSGADLIGKKELTSGSGDESANPLWFGGEYSIGDWLDAMLAILNKKPSLTGSAESIHNIWNFLTKIKLSGANAAFIEGADADTWTGDTVKLFESLPFGGSGVAIRVYYSEHGIKLCINCSFNGATGQYTRDVASPYRSMVIEITDRHIYFRNKHYAEASPWTDANWTTYLNWDSFESHAYFSNEGDASDYVRAGLFGKEYHGSASVYLYDGEAVTWHSRIGDIVDTDVYAYEDDNTNWDTSGTATVNLDHVDPWGCWISGHSNAVGAYLIAQWVGWIEVFVNV